MRQTVYEYLEGSAARRGSHIALTDGQSALTYCQLEDAAQRIGSGLSSLVPPGAPVGLYLDKTPEAICAIWGTIAAGCFYSVLNPELPAPRLQTISQVLRPGAVITMEAALDRARALFPEAAVVSLESLLETRPQPELTAVRRERRIDTDPLYVNFTSGSTGIPKGIAVASRSVFDFIDRFTEIFSITGEDVIANQAPFDFDVSVKDIYSAARVGATLTVVPRRLFSAPAELMDFLCDQGTTTMIWAVSALCLLSTFHALDYRVPERVNKILFSGEVMPARALADFRRHLPKTMFVNLYGPTEITCNCTYHILTPDRDYSGGIPIGIPFPNEDVFLLDGENRRITEPETPGELCVRGTALALGYFRCPEQNEAHFVQNPLNPAYPETIYRTGDLAKYNDRGELMFAGRKDFQIKYMGHRIELEEVEREMGKLPGVERCCCIFEEKRSRLKGFYVGTAEPDAVHAAMKEALPVFMIPGFLRRVEEMPLTKNGKIDRNALAEMGGRKKV